MSCGTPNDFPRRTLFFFLNNSKSLIPNSDSCRRQLSKKTDRQLVDLSFFIKNKFPAGRKQHFTHSCIF